ncbi:MAG: hypothetical protein AABX36_05015, partial [Candidatus Thermoplasmatota archaeon]
ARPDGMSEALDRLIATMADPLLRTALERLRDQGELEPDPGNPDLILLGYERSVRSEGSYHAVRMTLPWSLSRRHFTGITLIPEMESTDQPGVDFDYKGA